MKADTVNNVTLLLVYMCSIVYIQLLVSFEENRLVKFASACRKGSTHINEEIIPNLTPYPTWKKELRF